MVERQVDRKKGRADGPTVRERHSEAKKLRREIYKRLPAATWSLVQQVDPKWTSAETIAHFATHQDAGVDSRGAACAMQRACAENGLRAWCYEFGDPARFTHMVVLVEEDDGHMLLHDPYLDLEGDGDVFDMLDRIGNESAVALKSGSATRTYVSDANLEDEVGRAWLGIPADAERGRRLQVRGGFGLLEATSPGYRTLRRGLGKAQLAALLAEPVALLSPLGEDDGVDLAERLGLNMGPAAATGTKLDARPMLATRRRADQSSAGAPAQVAGIIEQMSIDRSRLFEELMALQSRTMQLSGELGTAQVTVERAVAGEKQSRDALQQLSEQHEQMLANYREEVSRLAEALSAAEAEARVGGQAAEGHREEASRSAERLAQIKAEVDDIRGEAQRLTEALRAETEARQRAEAAAEYREELSRLTTAVLTTTEERQKELDEARAEARRLAEDLGAEAEARQRAEAAAAEIENELSQKIVQVQTAAEDRERELDEARAETRRLAEALTAAEADARMRGDAAAGHQAEVARLTTQLHAAANERDQLAESLQVEVSSVTARLLAAADKHRRELEEAQAETRHLATGLSIAEAEGRLGADAAQAAQAAQRDAARLKSELDAARLEARAHQQALAEALAALDRAAAAQPESAAQPAALVGPRAVSMLDSMTAGDAGVALSDGGIGARSRHGGCLCFGPYIHLAGGSYRLSVAVERPALSSLLPSRAIVEVVDGPHYLSRQDVRLQSSRTVLALDFEVPSSVRPRQIEFRILVGPNSFAKVRDLRLTFPA